MADSSQPSQIVQYTTQHSDLYESAEALNSLELANEDGEWIKDAFQEIIADLERHIIGIKHAICDLKIGGTLL